MTDLHNLHGFERDTDSEPTERSSSPTVATVPVLRRLQHQPIGFVTEISGGGSQIQIEGQRLRELASDPDPSVALSGQVGSQVKLEVGRRWLLANIRTLKMGEGDSLTAEIDFLGEGDEHEKTGKLVNFKRGITSYPIPGNRVFPVSGEDLKQMFAADDRANIEIGTVYPTKDVRGALYIDAMLGKHFALLGSTGTGKSTSAALIMHRICDMAPEGHIVMIDPHGEYSAAFKGYGELFNVDNLAMPYWLMNFEEHCEVIITSSGADKQRDADILAKCLLHARSKNRAAEGLTKLTVDSPIPYTLSDLTNAIQNEMGLLNKATDTAPYMRLKTKLDELKADPRYSFMFSGMLVADSMTGFISKIFRLPPRASRSRSSTCPAFLPTSPPWWSPCCRAWCSIMPSGRATSCNGPVLLVCEEAHRYVPSDKTSSGQAVRKILERIAKEGRKYGVSLGLITQRPSDLAEGVLPSAAPLSRCGSTTSATSNSSRLPCRKARAASWTSSRRSGTANASSAARACRSRSVSPLTSSNIAADRLVRPDVLRAVEAVRG
jgi:hypothetical protein